MNQLTNQPEHLSNAFNHFNHLAPIEYDIRIKYFDCLSTFQNNDYDFLGYAKHIFVTNT